MSALKPDIQDYISPTMYRWLALFWAIFCVGCGALLTGALLHGELEKMAIENLTMRAQLKEWRDPKNARACDAKQCTIHGR
jgi:hypothetical protein